MPKNLVAWGRIDLPDSMDASTVAAVLKPKDALNGFDMLPYRKWCAENLGTEGKEWGLVNPYGDRIWFRFHGAVTLFLMHWHQQDKPLLPEGSATVRFLPDDNSRVQWVERVRGQAPHEIVSPREITPGPVEGDPGSNTSGQE